MSSTIRWILNIMLTDLYDYIPYCTQTAQCTLPCTVLYTYDQFKINTYKRTNFILKYNVAFFTFIHLTLL